MSDILPADTGTSADEPPLRDRPGTYAELAPEYLASGYDAPIPLPYGKKKSPPTGYTGYGAQRPSVEQIAEWTQQLGDWGCAFVLTEGQLVIDVDNYAKGEHPAGTGAATLAALLAEAGCELPPGPSLRNRDDGSEKRPFRVPTGLKFKRELGPCVDVITATHRYVNAGVNPDTGKPERWYDAQGNPMLKPPHPDTYPELPTDMLPHVLRGVDERERRVGIATEPQAREWLDNISGGAMSNYIRRSMGRALDRLHSGGCRHDSMQEDVRWLVEKGAAGIPGVQVALELLKHQFVEAVKDDRDGGESEADAEFDDFVSWAARVCREDMFESLRMRDRTGGVIVLHRLGDGADDETPAGAEAVLPPTWAPVDMRLARDGRHAITPTIGHRTDDECLLYAGKVHSFYGESESGKTWAALAIAAQVLVSDEASAVLFVDFEDNAADVGNRLVALGVPDGVVDDPARFVYVKPTNPLSILAERDAFDEVLSRSYAFAVIDGVTESMAVADLNPDRNAEIAAWQLQQPRAIASRTGAAVVCIDHVTKDADTRGRFALGGQHKIAGLDGAAFIVEVQTPFGETKVGTAGVRLAKDRPGKLRGHLGVGYRAKDHTHAVATFQLDASDPEHLAPRFLPPDANAQPAERGKSKKATRRPTWEMEQVSRYWDSTADPRERSQNKTEEAMQRRCAGKDRNPSRRAWREAIGLLADEGFAEFDTDNRGSKMFRNLKVYREYDDPAKDTRTRGNLPLHPDDADAVANATEATS